ncbi:hypothetical protein BSLA_01f1307 [Burkholderia stabilis]|nr:hypothetical protein BSLA_01f1307 [Burkholderia stabilis]
MCGDAHTTQLKKAQRCAFFIFCGTVAALAARSEHMPGARPCAA